MLELALNQKEIDTDVLLQIDREIPYHILFVLSCENLYQVWIGYKQASAAGGNAFKVGSYYHTAWMPEEKLCEILKIAGLAMDAVYEKFVRQIAGEALRKGNEESLKESVKRDARRKELEKQIQVLQVKIRKEKHLNRQMELNGEVKRQRKELERL